MVIQIKNWKELIQYLDKLGNEKINDNLNYFTQAAIIASVVRKKGTSKGVQNVRYLELRKCNIVKKTMIEVV